MRCSPHTRGSTALQVPRRAPGPGSPAHAGIDPQGALLVAGGAPGLPTLRIRITPTGREAFRQKYGAMLHSAKEEACGILKDLAVGQGARAAEAQGILAYGTF